jgi:hypothetical protein
VRSDGGAVVVTIDGAGVDVDVKIEEVRTQSVSLSGGQREVAGAMGAASVPAHVQESSCGRVW